MADVANNPETPLDRQSAEGSGQEQLSRRAAVAAILVFWILQFLYFSLDKFFRGEEVLWSTIAVRAIVSSIGAIISFHILKILQRGAGASFVSRAIVALLVAGAAAAIHSLINWTLFFVVNGPTEGGEFSLATEAATYPPLFYLFTQVYLAITVILLSLTYGGEIILRERRIAELTRDADRTRQVDDAHIWLRNASGRVRVDISEIDWISAEGECVRFHCGGRTFLERLSISAAAEKLDGLGFIRIHRSTLVNSQRIVGLTRTNWGAMQLRLTDGTELRVSKSFQPEVRKLAERLKP